MEITILCSIIFSSADKKQKNVKKPGELKAETVNNGDGTDGTKEKTGNMKSDNKQTTEGEDKTSTGGNNRYIFQYFIQNVCKCKDVTFKYYSLTCF